MNSPIKKTFTRYKAATKLEGKERKKALVAYVAHYAKVAETTPELLNQKVPRAVFSEILIEIGALMQTRSRELASSTGKIRDFLDANALPQCLGTELTDEVRAFCLLLNAVRQWSVCEQLAMDRFLISGNVRKELKELYTICPVAPDDIDTKTVELHHPLRDGRPPLPLSKKGHAQVEGILVIANGDTAGKKMVEFRKTSRSPISWKRLRVGCLSRLGNEPEGFEKTYVNGARNWVNRIHKKTGLDENEVLEFLDRYSLGLIEE